MVASVSGTLCAQASWSADRLLDEAATSSGVARERLSIAKPPTVGAKALTPKLVASLKWDDPKIIACAKVGSFPLQLRDSDVILLRDSATAASNAAAAAKSAPTTKGGRGRGAGNKPWQNAGVVGGGGGREAGLSIKTIFDEPLSAPSVPDNASVSNDASVPSAPVGSPVSPP